MFSILGICFSEPNQIILVISSIIIYNHPNKVEENREKLTPSSLSEKCPHWFNPFSPCLGGHPINFENSYVFCTKKYGVAHLKNLSSPCPQNACTGQISPLTADVFYEQPLTAITVLCVKFGFSTMSLFVKRFYSAYC